MRKWVIVVIITLIPTALWEITQSEMSIVGKIPFSGPLQGLEPIGNVGPLGMVVPLPGGTEIPAGLYEAYSADSAPPIITYKTVKYKTTVKVDINNSGTPITIIEVPSYYPSPPTIPPTPYPPCQQQASGCN